MTNCWAITDGAAGNERQALALAQALDVPAQVLSIPLQAPWSWVAPRLLPGGRLAVPAAFRPRLAPPWPDLAIGCGRAAALLTRLLARLSDSHTRTVQILDPRIDPHHWDLVVAPRHDGLSGPNVLVPLGSLNPVDSDWLENGREACPQLGDLPRPRIGVLVGGPRRGAAMDAGAIADAALARQRHEGGSVLLLTSRRTPETWSQAFAERLRGVPGLLWRGAMDGPNPYAGVLGWADRLLVTPDSVNMLSEACAVGCSVHSWSDAVRAPKLARFHAALREAGRLHTVDAEVPMRQAPLRETARIAAEVRRRLLVRPPSPAGT